MKKVNRQVDNITKKELVNAGTPTNAQIIHTLCRRTESKLYLT